MVGAIKEKRRKILVTGSSGMLGADLCGELSGDYHIIGLDVKSPVSFIRCDITDKDKTVKSIVSAKPDLVIHIAAWTDVDGCEENPKKAKRINEEGTGNVALSASELDVPLFYVSTDFVFDGHKKSPYNEEDTANPINVYGRSKLGGEKKVAVLNKYIILRTSWMYGANGKNFVDTILTKVKKEKELKVVDDQVGCPTYTKDFAKGIKSLLGVLRNQKPATEGSPERSRGKNREQIYHISNKGAVSWFDYAKEILKIAKVNGVKLIPIKSIELARSAKRPAFSVLDNNKFEKTTGFIMRPWKEALSEYINEATTYGGRRST